VAVALEIDREVVVKPEIASNDFHTSSTQQAFSVS
jgi:hypothetical protein